ncbi:ribonuclease T2 family protein [Actibacterium lipolyticum]|uniref:Ribonuclease I n=1 Tax=Actibacterium lipolyticum TaxID=1524263 RepID=A0A238KQX1_9RHOB|nr:ribonuclease T2 [Actibacterium lipolyticum]SMX45175.1 Ribonuclease I precursor [Actibacterium lipolyticum]
MRWLLILFLSTRLAHADGEPAGDFDYYVLSLSWSPTFCALEGDARNSPQCDPENDFGWVMHGLWPQYEKGWPAYCRTAERDPSRSETKAMADIMGTSGLAWYQWKKHGRCSGLSSEEYYATARRAYEAVTRPEVFRKLTRPVKLPASVVEEAFLQSNPEWEADMVTITCKAGRIQEARVCLTKDLELRDCGADVVRDCTMRDALMDEVR